MPTDTTEKDVRTATWERRKTGTKWHPENGPRVGVLRIKIEKTTAREVKREMRNY